MPKTKDSGFREQTNNERKDEGRDRQYKDFDKKEWREEDKFFQNDYDEWRPKMTKAEYNGVREYTGATYRQMNKYLREGKYGSGENETLEKLIKNCYGGIKKFALKDNTLVYRSSSDDLLKQLSANGITLEYPQSISPSQFVANVKRFIGSTVVDKGFTSTSTRSNTWDGRVRYNIRVPKGTNAAYVNHMSQHKSEFEMILNHGTKFKITGAHVNSNGTPVVDMIVVKK